MKDFFLHLKEKFSNPVQEDEEMEQTDTYVELGASPQREEQ